VQFEVQAPGDAALNIGKLLADGGAVGVFAGTLKHSGDIRANALTRDEGGRIVLKAQGDVTLAAGSSTSASGGTGGDITIQAAGSVTLQGPSGTLAGAKISASRAGPVFGLEDDGAIKLSDARSSGCRSIRPSEIAHREFRPSRSTVGSVSVRLTTGD